jgi:hypothetical protein
MTEREHYQELLKIVTTEREEIFESYCFEQANSASYQMHLKRTKADLDQANAKIEELEAKELKSLGIISKQGDVIINLNKDVDRLGWLVIEKDGQIERDIMLKQKLETKIALVSSKEREIRLIENDKHHWIGRCADAEAKASEANAAKREYMRLTAYHLSSAGEFDLLKEIRKGMKEWRAKRKSKSVD